MKRTIDSRYVVRLAIAAGMVSLASLSSVLAGPAANDAEAQARQAWRAAIAHTKAPGEGCFHASYPSMEWNKIECAVAPNIPYRPRGTGGSQKVGDGKDYAAEVTGLMSYTLGSFPTVTGVTSEKGLLGANDYSLQLNSNFMSTAACDGAAVPADCLSWEQFVYSSGYTAAFMQYWLIYWDTTCPKGWTSDGEGDCYTNSAAVTVPQVAATDLGELTLSGSAVDGGTDTLTMTVDGDAYVTTGKDSVVDLATDWSESEFNVIGDGDGSNAKFNTGVSITVQIQVDNGTTTAPTCAKDAGTTAETNNLKLGKCKGHTGSPYPYIEFTESN